MQSIFKPKHQKIILQCYPSTKLSIAETKPNQAELSYLVFYASSRRTKLEKVGNFLLKKTSSDISHKRVGHLKVTLYILQELIVKCSEDLGFMTPYVVSIMSDIVKLGDLSTCQLASEVFIIYCENLQQIQKQVFSSDIEVLKKFLNVISTFLNFAFSKLNSNEWLRISLNISFTIADYIDPSYSQFENNNLINKSLNLILSTLSNNQTDLSLVKVTSGVSAKIQSIEDKTIDELATFALKSFFDTSSKRQLDESTKSILQFIISNGKDLRWSNNIIIICCKKTHIELRHRILIIFSNEIETYVKNNKVDILDYLIKITSNMLNSNLVQFIGLPVLDILNKLIEFEQSMILYNEAHILKESYSDIIKSLSGRIYYNNQINDMIASVLTDYYYEVNNSLNNLNESQFYHYTEIIIGNIRDIVLVSQKPDIVLKISKFQLPIFNYIYLRFKFEQFPKISQQLQVIWLSLIEEFYRDNVDEDYSIPNFESLIINNNDNNLCLFFDAINKLLSNEDIRNETKAQISITISTLNKAFKLNFLMNYLKYSKLWLENPKDFKYSLSLLILGLSSSTSIQSGGEKLAMLADSKIAYSQNEKLWPEYIGYQPLSTPSSNVLTIDELITILNEIPEIQVWMSKINIDQAPSSISKALPKPHNNFILMSASNSVLSVPLPNKNPLSNIKPEISQNYNTISQETSSNDEHLMNTDNSDLDTSYTSEDFVLSAPHTQFNNASLRSGRSMRSYRTARQLNIQELKSLNNENGLSHLIQTRTAGTLGPNSAKTATINGRTKGSGLAYSIAAINLDDD